jgi:membrane protein
VTSFRDRGLRTADRVARRLPPTALRMLAETARDVRDLEVFDRAMTLAAQAFTTIFPLIIAIAAVRPGPEESLGADLADLLSSPPASRQVLEQAFPVEPRTLGAFGLLGLLIVLVSSTSFSRALARMYARIWQVSPPGRLRGAWRWIAALAALAVAIIVLGLLRRAWSGVPYDTLLDLLSTFALGTVLWTWTPWVLLAGGVDWWRLLPGGVLMGAGTELIAVGSQIYLPRALASAARQYGALGIAFAYISWLFVVMVVLVGTTVVGAVLAREWDRRNPPAGAPRLRFRAAWPSPRRTPPPTADPGS